MVTKPKNSRFSRVIRLEILLQSGGVADCETLRKQFKVSRRTIFRDLRVISGAGYKLAYNPEKGGYVLVAAPDLGPSGNGSTSKNGKAGRNGK